MTRHTVLPSLQSRPRRPLLAGSLLLHVAFTVTGRPEGEERVSRAVKAESEQLDCKLSVFAGTLPLSVSSKTLLKKTGFHSK